MNEINREQFVQRCKKSMPYPIGDQALADFEDFLKKYENQYASVRRLQVLVYLHKESFEGHPILIFDNEKLQKAFYEMGEDLPEEFAAFTFEQ